MDNNIFDDSIKQSMERLAKNTRPAPDSWEKMLSHLENYEQAQEDTFDTHIKNQFNPPSAVNTASKWDLLEQRLHIQDSRIKTLYRQKALESALLLLLLLTFTNIFFSVSDSNKNSIASNTAEKIFYPKQSIGTISNSASDKLAPNKSTEGEKSLILSNITQKGLTTQNNKTADIHIANTQQALNATPIVVLDSMANNDQVPNTTTFSQSAPEVISLVSPIAILPFTMLEYTKDNDLEAPALQLAIPTIKESKTHFALGIAGGTNLNIIHTPDEVFLNNPIPAYNSLMLGGSGGITLSIETTRHAYETGIFYMSKKYNPKDISIERIGAKGVIYTDALKQVQVNMLEVPLTYRIKKAINTKWSYYYQFGATANFITTTYYDTNRSYLSGLNSLGIGTTLAASELNTVKQFNAGLFDGGSWKDNTYGTAQLGVGLAYSITPKYSFFTQATFQQHLFHKNIGANNNSYNTLSLYWGLKRHF